jgi:hypothetical protein
MHNGLAPRSGLRALGSYFLLAGLTFTSAAMASDAVTVTQVTTVADTDANYQPFAQPVPYDDPNAQPDSTGSTDLNDRPAIRVDGKSCRPCCPGCCPGGSAGGYGTGTGGQGMTGGQGTTGGQGLTLSPQQYAALDPTVSAMSFGGGGYLDIPFIVNQFRIRYDDAYDNNFPDRAEYFYAKCGCHGAPAVGPQNAGQAASFVNYQAVRTYLEIRLSRRFSMFAEVPVQFDNIHFPTASSLQTGGLADMNAGFKYNLLNRNGRYLTFQLRTYIPTGNPNLGLGTAHASIEPSLLYWRTLSDRAFIQGQFTDWTALGSSTGNNQPFSGNILEYGGGFGYVVYRRFDPTARSTSYAANLPPQLAPQNYFLVTPLIEGVGWTVLNGYQTNTATLPNSSNLVFPSATQSAAGDTILNLKLGIRFTKGFNSIYTGWAHGMTHDIWYRNMFRLEYRRFF